MSLLLDLADEQLGKHRVVLAGRPEELVPWKEWTCYKGTFSITRLAGHGSIRYVDGREDSTFGGTFFPSLAETELRTPYMRRVCKRSKWSWRDEEAMWDVQGGSLPDYWDPNVPDGPMVCVDAKAYYVQLMERFSTQVEYRAGTGSWAPTGGYWVDLGELRRHKVLYASCVTRTWRSKAVTLYKRGVAEQKASTWLYQPQAWRLVMDITHAWAYEARLAFPVARICVDEVWLPQPEVESYQAWLAERWGLSSVAKAVWVPGEYWPLWHRDRVREQPQLVRDRLARNFTGSGAGDGAFEL